jgi:hypothetical protein
MSNESPIETKPFTEICRIQPVKLSDYSNLANYVRNQIAASPSIEDAVALFLVNMYLNITDNFYMPNKYYSRIERNFTRDQLDVFKRSISGLEVLFYVNRDDSSKGSIGNFTGKKRVQATNFSDLLESDAWKGNCPCHLMYVDDPKYIASDTFEKERAVGAAFEERYYKQMEDATSQIEKYMQHEEIKAIEAKLDANLEKAVKRLFSGEPEEEEEAVEQFKKCFGDAGLTPMQNEFIDKLFETLKFVNRVHKEVDDEIAKLPDDAGILRVLSQNVMPYGVVIIGSPYASGLNKVFEVPGLRLIEESRGILLYQKEK